MFRELTRKQKQLPREVCVELLQAETRGVLSVLGDDGYPYGMPMNHFYNPDDGKLWFHCGKGSGHRADAIARCGKVSFCVTERGMRAEGEWAYTVRSVIVFGRIVVVDDLARVVEVTTKLSRRFTQDTAYIQNEIARFAHETLLLELTPEHICGKIVTEA